jgi:hypothetical protein
MKRIKCTALIFLLLALSGCGNLEKRRDTFVAQMDAFVGKSIDEVIKIKGVPTGTAELVSGGRVVEYAKSNRVTSGGGTFATYRSVYVPSANGGSYVSIPVNHTVPVSTSEENCKLLFTVSKDNIVVNWKAEGNNCY